MDGEKRVVSPGGGRADGHRATTPRGGMNESRPCARAARALAFVTVSSVGAAGVCCRRRKVVRTRGGGGAHRWVGTVVMGV